ncbi:MAG: methyltransferase domain-containing protein, partial [Bacteroidota bacterium]
MLNRGQELELDIKEMAFGGVGIGGIETDQGEFKVFVQNTIPQQRVKAKVVKSKRRHAECKLMEVLERSPLEQDIPYQPIPGAPYATLPIEEQHRFKRESTVDLLQRIGNIQRASELLEELIPSPENWHYRNKMEYSFSCIEYSLKEKKELDDQFALGFKHRGTWWAVENLDQDSGLFDTEFENNLPELRDWMKCTGLPAWHPPRREGYFRFLVVRKSFDQDQLLINLVTTSHDEGKFEDEQFVSKTLELLGEKRIAGIYHTINDDQGERVQSSAGAPKLIYGNPVVTEDIHGLKFDISMESFFQTNPASASRLYSKAIEYAGDLQSEDSTIMDLFCGTGTITQLLAQGTPANVVGVDIVEKAIIDAKKNADKNGVNQVEFYAADVGKFLFEHPEFNGKINTLVMDPPRGGIAPKTL